MSSPGSYWGGRHFFGPSVLRKGGWLMVTYSDSIQLGLLIVAIIGLVLKIIEMDRNHRQ